MAQDVRQVYAEEADGSIVNQGCNRVPRIAMEEKTYTAEDVKILCIEAIIYFLEHQGKEKIDIIDFFEQVGL